MQEKDLKQKLNQELEEMAPDILGNILAKPRVPLKNEKELFGDNKPLFKEKRNYKKIGWFVAAAAMFVVVIAIATIVTINNRSLTPQITGVNQAAYSIMIDVNPSVKIDVDRDGKVVKLSAGNSDAKEIVEHINQKISEDTTYEEVMAMVVKGINKKHYFEKKDSAMLVSIISDKEKNVEGKKTEVKDAATKIINKQKITCKAIYQKCIVTDEIKTVAKKNKVSVGKAALCMKLAKKEKTSVKNMCKKKISVLVKEAERTGILMTDEIVDYKDDIDIETQYIDETEVIDETGEPESIEEVSEPETMEEIETEAAGNENVPAESSVVEENTVE